jgi:hypothetical protein
MFEETPARHFAQGTFYEKHFSPYINQPNTSMREILGFSKAEQVILRGAAEILDVPIEDLLRKHASYINNGNSSGYRRPQDNTTAPHPESLVQPDLSLSLTYSPLRGNSPPQLEAMESIFASLPASFAEGSDPNGSLRGELRANDMDLGVQNHNLELGIRDNPSQHDQHDTSYNAAYSFFGHDGVHNTTYPHLAFIQNSSILSDEPHKQVDLSSRTPPGPSSRYATSFDSADPTEDRGNYHDEPEVGNPKRVTKRKRRGCFKDLEQRRETGLTRSMGACIRCSMQRIRVSL